MESSLSMIAAKYDMDRQTLYAHFEENVKYTLRSALEKDDHYTLFRQEDAGSWLIFTTVFLALIVFDNAVLNREHQTMGFKRASMFTFFWVMVALAFSGWVACWHDANSSFMWTSGYMLEWMLSFDNLFVFHTIFETYGTPDHLKHRPLYLGICGAVLLRLGFIFVGEYLMHAMRLCHLLFGAFLVYTGYQTMIADDDDEDDPSKHPFVQWLQSRVPFVSLYDSTGSFFVKVPVGEDGQIILPKGQSSSSVDDSDNLTSSGAVNFEEHLASVSSICKKSETRATMLFLVTCCLEISDLLFAVDSVSAIVAQVNDLFLAYTSAVFAMLGLRAAFFVVDELIRLCSLLKYGVALVLMFIGAKLMADRIYHVPPSVVCVVLVSAISSSVLASLVQDRYKTDKEGLPMFNSDEEANVAKCGYQSCNIEGQKLSA